MFSTKSPLLDKEPTIKISLYTHTPNCCYIDSILPCSHIFSHSSAVIEHLPTKRDYLVSYGTGLTYDDAYFNLLVSGYVGYYSYHDPITIMAYENEEKNFDKFKKDCDQRYNTRGIWCPCSNCADATTFAIDYFPRQPAEESFGCLYWVSKITFGFFGSFLCISACDTFPGINNPREVEKRGRRIQKQQQESFTSQSPIEQKMEDEKSEQDHKNQNEITIINLLKQEIVKQNNLRNDIKLVINEYLDKRNEFHPPSQKKQMLDSLMNEISYLYPTKRHKKLFTLYATYLLFINLNLNDMRAVTACRNHISESFNVYNEFNNTSEKLGAFIKQSLFQPKYISRTGLLIEELIQSLNNILSKRSNNYHLS